MISSCDNTTTNILNSAISLQQQATIEQLEHRKRWIDRNIDNGCLTASSFGCAVGLKGLVFHYVHYLRQQVGTKHEFRGNAATFHGQRTENTSKMVYELLCCEGRTVDEGGFYAAVTKETGEGHLACSPDGVVTWCDENDANTSCGNFNQDEGLSSELGQQKPLQPQQSALWQESPSNFLRRSTKRPRRLLEIKSPIAAIYNGAKGDQTPHGIPKAYMCQIQGQLYITGAEECDFFVFVARYPPELALWRVRKSPEFWDWMLPKLLQVCRWVATAPKDKPTEEILARDFKFDDFPDWGKIPVEGIYVPTNMISGSPIADVKTFPYFFASVLVAQGKKEVRAIRGKVPDRATVVLHPLMRALVAKNVREGDWILLRSNFLLATTDGNQEKTTNNKKKNRIENNVTVNRDENSTSSPLVACSSPSKYCACCGSEPSRLVQGGGNVVNNKQYADDEIQNQGASSHIVRVLAVRPDLNKIEGEVHFFFQDGGVTTSGDYDDDEEEKIVVNNLSQVSSSRSSSSSSSSSSASSTRIEKQQRLLSLTPQRQCRHQKAEQQRIVRRVFTSCPFCCPNANEDVADHHATSGNQLKRTSTKTIFFEPTKFDDIAVIRRKARPVKDEIRFWKNSIEEERERRKTMRQEETKDSEQEKKVEEHNDDDTSILPSKQQQQQQQSNGQRKFFTSTSIQLIIQLWNDPIKVLLRSPTCKSLSCLAASIQEIRQTIGGHFLVVSPKCGAAIWHVVSLLDKEEQAVEAVLFGSSSSHQNDSQDQPPQLNVQFEDSAASSSPSSACASNQSSRNNSQQHQINYSNVQTPTLLADIKTTKELQHHLKLAETKNAHPRLWVQESFKNLSSVCHKLLLNTIHAAGSVEHHILVGNRICAVMTLKVFNNLLNENKYTGHHRRRASPLLPPPNPKTVVLSVMKKKSSSSSSSSPSPLCVDLQDIVANNESGINCNNSTNNSQSFFPAPPPTSSPLSSSSCSSAFSSANNSQQQQQNQPQQIQPPRIKLLHDVWTIPLWIVCSDTKEITDVVSGGNDSKNTSTEEKSSVVECGELPDIYKLIESCSARDVEAPWVWFVSRNQ